MSKSNTTKTGYTCEQWIRKHYDLAQQFPRKGAWTLSTLDIDREIKGHLYNTAERVNVIEQVGTWHNSSNSGTDSIQLWSLTEKARLFLEIYQPDERKMELPCGHSGFKNLTDEPYLQCKHCDGRFTKEEVQSHG